MSRRQSVALRVCLLALLSTAGADLLAHQDDFKGNRAPNPTVNRKVATTAKPRTPRSRTTRPARVTVAEQIEEAIDRGNVARDADNLEEAEKQYNRAIDLNKNEWRAWYGLGNVYNDGGNYDRAVDALTEAIRLNADSAEAHHSLGTSYFLKERYFEAISQYRESVRLKPDYTYAYYDLGMAYMKVKDKEKALQQYEVLKKLNPGLAANLRSYIR